MLNRISNRLPDNFNKISKDFLRHTNPFFSASMKKACSIPTTSLHETELKGIIRRGLQASLGLQKSLEKKSPTSFPLGEQEALEGEHQIRFLDDSVSKATPPSLTSSGKVKSDVFGARSRPLST